jgi:putative PIN family toxin of toxin-antitoxin system
MEAANVLPSAYSRVVVDTNVLLSAALSPNGAPAQLVDRLLADAQIVFSEQTFAELKSRLWKPKFDRYLTMERRHSLLHDFNAVAHWVDVPAQIASVRYSRDATDDAFIHTALAAGALRLVTGDDDLLCLDPIAKLELRIVTPRKALDEFGA